MPLRGREGEAITSADKLQRTRGGAVSRGTFLTQGERRDIKTAGLITTTAVRGYVPHS